MNLAAHKLLFNIIAPGYNWFYKGQKKNYSEILLKYGDKLDIPDNGKVLDVGCGTGALTKALMDMGYDITGVDIARNMLRYGTGRGLDCRFGDIVSGLDFEDNSFDLVTFAFVAHGLDAEKRRKLFTEAARLSRKKVLFHDYSTQRSIMTNIIEFVEGGDYFNFIKTGLSEMEEVFSSVEVVKIKKYTNWYICSV